MKYRKLVVSGCSFTHSEHSWAYVLAEKYNLELVNLAAPGAGNTHISTSLTLYLNKEKPDPNTTLVGIMWSNPGRKDLLARYNKNLEDHFLYKYDNFNHLVTLAGTVQDIEKNKKLLSQMTNPDLFLSIFFPGNEAKVLQSWLHMKNTTSGLLDQGYDFFQTPFIDFFNGSKVGYINYTKEPLTYNQSLKMLGLEFDSRNFLNLSHSEILGEYAVENNLLDFDGLHPSQDGYFKWTENILIPNLQQLNIL